MKRRFESSRTCHDTNTRSTDRIIEEITDTDEGESVIKKKSYIKVSMAKNKYSSSETKTNPDYRAAKKYFNTLFAEMRCPNRVLFW